MKIETHFLVEIDFQIVSLISFVFYLEPSLLSQWLSSAFNSHKMLPILNKSKTPKQNRTEDSVL